MNFEKLTPEEQAFATEHHGLLIRFMRSYQLDDELYGAMSLRYLKVVHRYLSEPELRKYKFSAVLWLNLRSQLSHELRKPKYHAEIVPWEESMQTALRDDDVGCDELWGKLEKNLSKRNLEILFYSAQGNSYREIADACHLTIRAVACRLYRLRKKIRGL